MDSDYISCFGDLIEQRGNLVSVLLPQHFSTVQTLDLCQSISIFLPLYFCISTLVFLSLYSPKGFPISSFSGLEEQEGGTNYQDKAFSPLSLSPLSRLTHLVGATLETRRKGNEKVTKRRGKGIHLVGIAASFCCRRQISENLTCRVVAYLVALLIQSGFHAMSWHVCI